MSKWRAAKLGALTINFDSQRRPIKSTERVVGSTPYYGASGVIDAVLGHTHEGEYLLIAEDGENLRTRNTPIGFMARGRIWVNNHAHVVQGAPGLADTRFLKHSLSVTDISGYLTGSTQPKLTRAAMDSILLQTPPLPEQRAIAEVLGALDDKIAANATLTAAALELADAIFQHTVGELAFGSTTFEEVASVQGGGTPSTKVEDFWGGDISWATPTDVTNLGAPYLERTARTITQAGFEACSSALHPAGSILMTSRATIGAFAIAQTPTAVNQGFIVVNAYDPLLQLWLFHEMRSRVPEFLSHANGATFLELSRGRFKKLSVRCPDDAAAFQAEVDPIHLRARAAAVEAERLTNMRDLLLPQLMSGNIKVKDAERVVEGVV